jgi:hypothetical protein
MIFLSKLSGPKYYQVARLFVVAMLLFVAGCKEKFPSVPSDIIPIKKMENILIDMHISDAVAETKTMGGGKAEMKLSEQYYMQIYKNYGITKADFLKSYTFYQNNPVLLNQLYDNVLGEMSKREAKINK